MRLLTSIIFLFLFISLKGQILTAQYGGGVVHQNSEPTTTPNYQLKPSLLVYDYNEQAIWGHSQAVGKFKIMSPQMRYVRGFININFNDSQTLPYSYIHTQLQTQSLNNNPLNGLYLVKFTSNSGALTEFCEIDMESIPNLILTAPVYFCTNNDYFLIRYERGVLKQVQHINDKANIYFQSINDSLNQHRREIDSLKNAIPPKDSIVGLENFLTKYKSPSGLKESKFYDSDTLTGILFKNATKLNRILYKNSIQNGLNYDFTTDLQSTAVKFSTTGFLVSNKLFTRDFIFSNEYANLRFQYNNTDTETLFWLLH